MLQYPQILTQEGDRYVQIICEETVYMDHLFPVGPHSFRFFDHLQRLYLTSGKRFSGEAIVSFRPNCLRIGELSKIVGRADPFILKQKWHSCQAAEPCRLRL